MLNEDIAHALDAPYNEAAEQGRKQEREAVCTWLRTLFPIDDDRGMGLLLSHLATAIEAEEHLEGKTEEIDR